MQFSTIFAIFASAMLVSASPLPEAHKKNMHKHKSDGKSGSSEPSVPVVPSSPTSGSIPPSSTSDPVLPLVPSEPSSDSGPPTTSSGSEPSSGSQPTSSGSSEPSSGGSPPSSSSSGNTCGQNQQQSCCESPEGLAAVGAQCTLSLIGGTCSGSVQCCDVEQNGAINLINVCVPIQIG